VGTHKPADEHPASAANDHIVDVLIAERAQWLRTQPLVWATVRRWLFPLLRYREAVALADDLGRLDGPAAFDALVERLQMDLVIDGLANVPQTGGCVIVANHPTGIADGVAVWAALRARRPDLAFLANRDAIRVAPGLASVVIPVEWRAALRSRADSRATAQGLARVAREQRALVLFPSGRLARPSLQGLRERPWQPSAVALARRYDLPIVPLHIRGRNSLLFYLFWLTSEPLRDMTLFHELINKRGVRYRLSFGPARPPGALDADAAAATRSLQALVESGRVHAEHAPHPRRG
jgi:putative hemolysin